MFSFYYFQLTMLNRDLPLEERTDQTDVIPSKILRSFEQFILFSYTHVLSFLLVHSRTTDTRLVDSDFHNYWGPLNNVSTFNVFCLNLLNYFQTSYIFDKLFTSINY